jgi:hypothetical protein
MYILEIDQLPRDKTLLQGMVNDAKTKMKRSNRARFISVNLMAWAMIIMFVWSPMQNSKATALDSPYMVYAPLIHSEVK